MKNKTVLIALSALFTLFLSGCWSTVTHYDKDGKVTRVEKVTNTSRFFDGTNSKSQMVLIEGTYAKSDISVTAGESYTPGWTVTFANGKTALINAKDAAKFTGVDGVVQNFFKNTKISKEGIETGGGNSAAPAK